MIPIPNTTQIPNLILTVATKELSGNALKVLLYAAGRTLMFGVAWEPISVAQFCEGTALTNKTIFCVLRDLLQEGWLLERRYCPLCDARVNGEERLADCIQCGRRVSPRIEYALNLGEEVIQKLENARYRGGVEKLHTGMEKLHTRMENMHRGVQNLHRGMENFHTPSEIEPGKNLHTGVENFPTLDSVESFRIKESDSAESRKRSPTESALTGDIAESKVINKQLEEWRKENERLARYSVRTIGDIERALGFHIRVWSHARRVDQERGDPLVTTKVHALMGELERARLESGRPQGKVWNTRIQKLFTQLGHPLETRSYREERDTIRDAIAHSLAQSNPDVSDSSF